MNGIDQSTGVLQAASAANTVSSANPASVHQICMCVRRLSNASRKDLSINKRMEHTESITSEQNDVLGLVIYNGRNPCIGDEGKVVCYTTVFSDRSVIKIHHSARVIIHDIFQDGTKSNSIIDFRFLLPSQTHRLGIATPLNVENTFVSPDMLVISNKFSFWICTQSCLSSSRKAEKDGNIIV